MNDRLERRRSCLALAAVVAVALAPTARAANTVLNPNFNADVSFWNTFLSGISDTDPLAFGSAMHTNAQDVDGIAPASGAVAVTLDGTGGQPKAAAGARQCVDLGQPAPTVTEANYGARFKIPGANASDASVNVSVEIRFYSDAGCTTFIPGAGGVQGRNIGIGVPDDAFWYAAADGHFIPPPGTVARSAEVRAGLRRVTGSAAAYTGFFDNVYLSLNGTTPVSLQQFQVD
ncbi:MAG TPA: hypothetical protein VM555_04840 [Tahibacter sp.]|nr:hypothetical protein [Tahibacter sp.]